MAHFFQGDVHGHCGVGIIRAVTSHNSQRATCVYLVSVQREGNEISIHL